MVTHRASKRVTIEASQLHETRHLTVSERDGAGELRTDLWGNLEWSVEAPELNINSEETSRRQDGVIQATLSPTNFPLAQTGIWLPTDATCGELAEGLLASCVAEVLYLPAGVRLSAPERLTLTLSEAYPLTKLEMFSVRVRGQLLVSYQTLGPGVPETCVGVYSETEGVIQSAEETDEVLLRPMQECAGLLVVAGSGSSADPAWFGFVDPSVLSVDATGTDVFLRNLVGDLSVGDERHEFDAPGPSVYVRGDTPAAANIDVRIYPRALSTFTGVTAEANADELNVASATYLPTLWEENQWFALVFPVLLVFLAQVIREWRGS